MPQDDRRRQPAVRKDIDDIDADDDVRVRVLGTVLEARQDSVMLDDGSGTAEVFLDADDLDAVEEGQRVRVFGRVLPAPDGFEIQGEILQDMSDLYMDLYTT
ncbi:MAG: OB-fold nucleic acid binding domain-containing protein, partial [Candidatus Nanohaloarchaea archaeon]